MFTQFDHEGIPDVPEWTEESMAEHADYLEREGRRKAHSIAWKVSRRFDTRCKAFFDEVEAVAFAAMWEEAGFVGIKAYRHGFNAAMRAGAWWRRRGMKGRGYRRFAGVSKDYNPVSNAPDHRRRIDAEAVEEATAAIAKMDEYQQSLIRLSLAHKPGVPRQTREERLMQIVKSTYAERQAAEEQKRVQEETGFIEFVAETLSR